MNLCRAEGGEVAACCRKRYQNKAETLILTLGRLKRQTLAFSHRPDLQTTR